MTANTLMAHLEPSLQAQLDSLSSPDRIQAFLDSTTYSADTFNRSPVRVMQDRVAHCLDGGLFAAAALRQLGYPPLIVDLLPEPGTDDDHILALFRRNGCWGAVAKSNYTGLRFREPVYRSLRELVMSYFDVFYNVEGQKTLRAYTRPVHLSAYDRLGWMWSDAGVDAIEKRLYKLHPIPLISADMAKELSPMDERSYQGGMLGVNEAGLYRPKQ